MKEEKVLIKGVESNFKIAGEGKPLLILHGWGVGSSNSWRNVQRILSALGYTVVVPDFPGFGKSGKPGKAWSISDYVEWLNSFVNSLKLRKFSVIAHSFGARVAVKFINRYPGKVDKLILCSPAGIKPKASLETKMVFLVTKIGNIILKTKHLEKPKKGLRRLFYVFLPHKDYTKAQGVMKETIKKVLAEDLTGYLSKIDKKTLIVWGKRDKIVPLRHIRIFDDKIKGSQLVVLAGAGHSPHLKCPEKLLEKIIKFL